MTDRFYVLRMGGYYFEKAIPGGVQLCTSLVHARRFEDDIVARREWPDGELTIVTQTIEEVPA